MGWQYLSPIISFFGFLINMQRKLLRVKSLLYSFLFLPSYNTNLLFLLLFSIFNIFIINGKNCPNFTIIIPNHY